MQSGPLDIYLEAIESVKNSRLLLPAAKKSIPKHYIVATHGPALTKAVIEDPGLLNLIGIYRLNCSHLGKEQDLEKLAEYLRVISPFVPILIDLQGPKPRIHEITPGIKGLPVKRGDRFIVTYESGDSENRFCTPGNLKVCFPEIVEIMEVGDTVIFDDGKMTAVVREKSAGKGTIECTEIAWEDGGSYILGGRKGICVRNKPLGIECITDHDRKSIEFARDILGFDFVHNIMVSYFSTLEDIEHFVRIMREEYDYSGNLGGKFETPFAVLNTDEILSSGTLSLAMLGRGDLRVEMDPRALKNMYDIQVHFFSSCRKYHVESICATGFLESMLTVDGQVTPEEINDMQTSMRTGPDHIMLSGETSYGAQAKKCIETEVLHQRDTYEKLEKKETDYLGMCGIHLGELLYIA